MRHAVSALLLALALPAAAQAPDRTGFSLGGLLYSFSRSVALDVGLDVTAGRFTETSFDGESTGDFDEIDSGIARLGVGLVWHP